VGINGGDTDCGERFHEMLNLLDVPPDSVRIVDEHYTLCFGGSCWGTAVRPCLVKQAARPTRSVSYQLDGRSSAHIKNAPASESVQLFNWADSAQVSMVRVGLPLSVKECADVIAQSTAFVGVCSGMSMLALSVGVPVFILEYDLKIDWWYGQNRFIKCPGISSLLLPRNDHGPTLPDLFKL